ncbi:hypothetical protein BC832DRAFT_562754 [Gaertneriomyces semiglobifer]|nr:hypothetical protein BC832DRAFT_562754 [Gaertneriomyces semiglobifer]
MSAGPDSPEPTSSDNPDASEPAPLDSTDSSTSAPACPELATLPVDCLLLIISHLPLASLRTLSQTCQFLYDTLHCQRSHIFTLLTQTHISPYLFAAYKTSHNLPPFTPYDIDIESRVRRGVSSPTRNRPEEIDHGAVYFYLKRRQKCVVEFVGDAVEMLVGNEDSAVRQALAENVDKFHGDGKTLSSRLLRIESIRTYLLLHSLVETLTLCGCSAIMASKSSPGITFTGSKYARLFLSDFDDRDLLLLFHAIGHLGLRSFTKPSDKWRSDAQGFEVSRFEVLFLRPFLRRALVERGHTELAHRV